MQHYFSTRLAAVLQNKLDVFVLHFTVALGFRRYKAVSLLVSLSLSFFFYGTQCHSL